MKRKTFLIVFAVMAIALSNVTSSFAYSSVVSFGDSLSDNGDADGYGFDVWSDGDVWVDYLADKMGASVLDMAYGGARTYGHPAAPESNPEMYGLGWQVDEYIGMGSDITQDMLFTVWAGGNDLLNMDSTNVGDTIMQAVTNIAGSVEALYAAGAQNILVMNMPNLGATPYMNGSPETYYQGEYLSQAFNSALSQSLSVFGSSSMNLMEFDVFSLMNEFIVSDLFDNDTDMLLAAGQTSDTYLFWDSIHPTTYAHRLIAEAVYSEIVPTPEPTTFILFGTGLTGLLCVYRRRNQSFRERGTGRLE